MEVLSRYVTFKNVMSKYRKLLLQMIDILSPNYILLQYDQLSMQTVSILLKYDWFTGQMSYIVAVLGKQMCNDELTLVHESAVNTRYIKNILSKYDPLSLWMINILSPKHCLCLGEANA